jgi:hypothetical protein
MVESDSCCDEEEQNEEKDTFFSFLVYWILELMFFSKGH